MPSIVDTIYQNMLLRESDCKLEKTLALFALGGKLQKVNPDMMRAQLTNLSKAVADGSLTTKVATIASGTATMISSSIGKIMDMTLKNIKDLSFEILAPISSHQLPGQKYQAGLLHSATNLPVIFSMSPERAYSLSRDSFSICRGS